MVRALDATLRLAGIGTQNLDVKFRQRPSELGHSIAAGCLLVRHPKDGMLVGVEGDGFTVATKIRPQRLEIGKCALGWDKTKLHQAACRIVDEHQQRASSCTILEPAMLRAVDLDQLTNMLAP